MSLDPPIYQPSETKPYQQHLAEEKARYLAMLIEQVSDIIISRCRNEYSELEQGGRKGLWLYG